MQQEAREVRGAEKCRAGPLRREVLRAAGVPNGARGGVRRCGAARMGDAEARAKHRIVCQHGGCAWVQGPGWSHDREHRARLQEEESCVCVDAESFGQAAQCAAASRGVTRGPMRVGRSMSRHAPGELGDWMHLCVSSSRAVRSRRVP